jgi:hypothetical protein
MSMIRPAIRRFMVIAVSLFFSLASMAQPIDEPTKKVPKPYRILTSGKQVTVKSTKNIKNIMVWTASGHRIVEQKEVNAPSYNFSVSGAREKVFFVMVQYEGSKPFTEKIGVQ